MEKSTTESQRDGTETEIGLSDSYLVARDQAFLIITLGSVLVLALKSILDGVFVSNIVQAIANVFQKNSFYSFIGWAFMFGWFYYLLEVAKLRRFYFKKGNLFIGSCLVPIEQILSLDGPSAGKVFVQIEQNKKIKKYWTYILPEKMPLLSSFFFKNKEGQLIPGAETLHLWFYVLKLILFLAASMFASFVVTTGVKIFFFEVDYSNRPLLVFGEILIYSVFLSVPFAIAYLIWNVFQKLRVVKLAKESVLIDGVFEVPLKNVTEFRFIHEGFLQIHYLDRKGKIRKVWSLVNPHQEFCKLESEFLKKTD